MKMVLKKLGSLRFYCYMVSLKENEYNNYNLCAKRHLTFLNTNICLFERNETIRSQEYNVEII